MLLSPAEGLEFAPEYPELAGRRVLVTGLGGPLGVEIVRLLAEQRTRLVLVADAPCAEVQALAEIVVPQALDVQLYTGPFPDDDAVLRLARSAVQRFGGVDVVINLSQMAEAPAQAGEAEISNFVARQLAGPFLAGRVAANRMRLTMTAGSIVNIVTCPRRASPRTRLLASLVRSALAEVTRSESIELSADGIRINAIAPADAMSDLGGSLGGLPDVASLVLDLAAGRGHELTGMIYDAYAG